MRADNTVCTKFVKNYEQKENLIYNFLGSLCCCNMKIKWYRIVSLKLTITHTYLLPLKKLSC